MFLTNTLSMSKAKVNSTEFHKTTNFSLDDQAEFLCFEDDYEYTTDDIRAQGVPIPSSNRHYDESPELLAA